MNILVTGVGSTTSQSVIKGLRRQQQYDVRIVGTDTHESDQIAGSAFCDSFHKVPLATEEEAYIDSIVNIVRTASIDLLIPIIDVELSVLSKHADRIRTETELLLSDHEVIEQCNEKRRTHDLFMSLDIPTPKTVDVDGDTDRETLESQVECLSYPIIVKPNVGVSSRDVYTIRNPDELCLVDRINDPIAQTRATGQEYTIDVFHDGESPVAAVPRKRLETRSGISYKGETVQDEQLIRYAERIADEINLYGPANIQCFKHEGTFQFIEINPRFSGSLPLSIEAGNNFPLYALQLAAGELDTTEQFDEVRMCRSWSEVYYKK